MWRPTLSFRLFRCRLGKRGVPRRSSRRPGTTSPSACAAYGTCAPASRWSSPCSPTRACVESIKFCVFGGYFECPPIPTRGIVGFVCLFSDVHGECVSGAQPIEVTIIERRGKNYLKHLHFRQKRTLLSGPPGRSS